MNYLEEIKNILVYNDYANKEYMLENAIKRGHVGVVKLLLEYKVNVHFRDNGALRMASEKGHVEIVRLLLEEGKANVHAMNNYALRYASRYGHTEVVRLLLEKGADVHADNDCALRLSSWVGHTEVVKLLLEKGADVHVDHALGQASWDGRLEIVKLLLEYKSKVCTKALINVCERGHIELVKLFLTKGYYHSSMDKIITENFYEWIQEFPIHSDFKRTEAMADVERRYLANENWIKGSRKPSSNFSDVSIILQ